MRFVDKTIPRHDADGTGRCYGQIRAELKSCVAVCEADVVGEVTGNVPPAVGEPPITPVTLTLVVATTLPISPLATIVSAICSR